MRISCSKAQSISSCGRQYYYRYEERLASTTRPLALAFGSAVDKALSTYVSEHALGRSFDLVLAFNEAWQNELDRYQILYPQHWDADIAREVGNLMMGQFPDVWEKSNLVAVVDSSGVPIVQRRIFAPLHRNHELELVLDALVMDLYSGNTGVLDFKTSAIAIPPESAFGHNSFQLSTYQYGAEHEFGDFLGAPISNVGFMELIKRKPPQKSGKGPTVEMPVFFPRRDDGQIADMLSTYDACLSDMESMRFNRPVSAAYNSPCDMCDFARKCVHNDEQGLFVRPERRSVRL